MKKYPTNKIELWDNRFDLKYKVLKLHKFLWFIPYYNHIHYVDNHNHIKDEIFHSIEDAEDYICINHRHDKLVGYRSKDVSYDDIVKEVYID